MENVDDPPRPVINNLYLTETSVPVKVNITTIDSTDPSDYYIKLVIYTYLSMYYHTHVSILITLLIHFMKLHIQYM